jgi:hypothetical protein
MGQMRWNVIGLLLFVTFAALGSGCATTGPSRGQSGSIEWEVVDLALAGNGYCDFTVILRETAGIGVSFHAVKIAFPDVPVVQEQVFVRRLEPHSLVSRNFRLQLTSANGYGTFPPYVELQFRGVDDASKPVDVTFRVYRSAGRQVLVERLRRG